MEIGYALSSEDHGPRDLVRIARAAEDAGFTTAWVSDHYHPWVGAQGSSPFVWSVLGGIAEATDQLRVGTGVTCPTVRMHPAVVAHAAATAAAMLDGRFFFGVGSGEYLNEHILGDRWPPTAVRLRMLEESVEIIRRLWSGDEVTHYGQHYTVENARLWDLPDTTPPIYVSAFGPKATSVAARIGDGFVGASPAPGPLEAFREQAGPDKPALAGAKSCWAETEEEGRRMAHRLWPNMGLAGELAQELRTTAHFEQAAGMVTEEEAAGAIPCGSDPGRYAEALGQYEEAGYDEVYLHNIGPDQEGFLRFFADEVRPLL